jgi:hypothetical protein
MESVTVMEGVMRWFDNANELLVNPDPRSQAGSIIDITGTFWSPQDFYVYVLEKYPEYHFSVVPAMKHEGLEDAGGLHYIQHPHQTFGETNYPEHPEFTTEYYKAMMTNPEKEMVFWTQHMNMPSKSTILTKFEESWIKYCRIEERQVDTPLA